jgi:hypothetical protein
MGTPAGGGDTRLDLEDLREVLGALPSFPAHRFTGALLLGRTDAGRRLRLDEWEMTDP